MKSGNESGEDLDIREVHGAILREHAEPREMLRAAPWWLKHGIYAPLSIWGIWYFLIASGGFRWDEYSEGISRTHVPIESGEPTPAVVASVDAATLVQEGEAVYGAVCAACHQANGAGLAGAFPPLAGSDWVHGPEANIILPVLHGLMGEIVVNGEKWNGVMPAQGATLDDRQVAAVISYIRAEWGNSAPHVVPAAVTALREKFKEHGPWTVDELESALAK